MGHGGLFFAVSSLFWIDAASGPFGMLRKPYENRVAIPSLWSKSLIEKVNTPKFSSHWYQVLDPKFLAE